MGQRRPPSADTALPSDGRDDHAPWLHGKSLDNTPAHHKPGNALSPGPVLPRPVLHGRTPTASADLQLVTLGVGRTAGASRTLAPLEGLTHGLEERHGGERFPEHHEVRP